MDQERQSMKRSIKDKIQKMNIYLGISIILLLGIFTLISVMNIRKNASDNLRILNEDATKDATSALDVQMQESLKGMAENRSALANAAIETMYHQTRQVALAAVDIYSNTERYTKNREISELPVDAFDFSCNLPEDIYGKYSIHLRAPREVMAEDSIKEEGGVVISARLDESKLNTEMRRDLYLAELLDSAIGSIRNFDNGDGTYEGIGASYFCIQSSGIDVLADTKTQKMIEYDARNSTWYTEAAKLGPDEVYWTNPVPDASGRGLSLICSMPVYVDGKLMGVAGSGGGIENIQELVQSTRIGSDGYAFLVNIGNPNGMTVLVNANTDKNSEINRYTKDLLKTDNQELQSVLQKIKAGESGLDCINIDNRLTYVSYSPLEITKWSIVVALPVDDDTIAGPIKELQGNIEGNTGETLGNINRRIIQIIVTFILFVAVVAAAVTLFSRSFAKRLTEPIQSLTEGAKRVSGGDLDVKLSVETGDELEILGDAFNHMTVSLVEYIDNLSRMTAEKERIGAELDVATRIQADMLPSIFPPFPDRNEFDLYASMNPAKEVGGDFYDFFMVDEKHLALVIADVSGKGVPAALFMMISKTLIKNEAQQGSSPKDVLESVNKQLCETNKEDMFVTVWLGILDVETGNMVCSNAGHEYPAIRRKGGSFELFQDKHGFVVGGMDMVRYKEYEITMEPGDIIFVYTDGVPEATDAKEELFGTERMLAALNKSKTESCEKILHNVKEEADAFVGEAPQFDDLTMLAMVYYGKEGAGKTV